MEFGSECFLNVFKGLIVEQTVSIVIKGNILIGHGFLSTLTSLANVFIDGYSYKHRP